MESNRMRRTELAIANDPDVILLEKEYLTSLIAERTEELEKELKERKLVERMLRQSNDLNNSLLQTIPFGMDIVDENGNILFMSDNLRKLFKGEVLGHKCWNLYRDDKLQCEACPLLKGINLGETSIYESQGVLGGKTFQISHTGMMYQGRKAMLEIFRDITEMKKVQEALIEAKDKAEESDNLKTAFLNNMRHEIRTPMNHIMGFASLMREADPEEKDAYAEIILKSSNQLLSLIENVILLSRFQSEKIRQEKQVFNPSELIDNVIRNFRSNESLNSNTLTSEIPEKFRHLSVIADMEKVKHILMNLASNAIKYTFEGNIRFGILASSGEMTFYVKDDGIGIPRKEQQIIFETFFRGEKAVSLVIGGTGLGLPIAKEMVNSLDGKIEVESEVNKGSVFSFTIPIQYASDPNSTKGHLHLPQILNEISLLIADDEMINFLYLEILLKNSVKKIDHAINGKIAIEMAHKHKYDLILMDMKMPGMDGLETTRAFKKDFPETPIILLTAYSTTEDMENARLAGCDDFISKPVKKEILFDVIRKYCR